MRKINLYQFNVNEQGNRLKKCLEHADMKQCQLAEKANFTPQYISNIVNGSKRITFQNAVVFADILGVRHQYLLLKDGFMTEAERVSTLPCVDFLSALGYHIQDLEPQPDGTYKSMHRPYSKIIINKQIDAYSRDDTDEEILEKAHAAVPERILVITDPTGKRIQVTQNELLRIARNIQDYARFQFANIDLCQM